MNDESPDQKDLRARDLEYYKWRLHSYYENEMVHDRLIIQISSAGIGLTVTLFAALKQFPLVSGAHFLVGAGLLLYAILIVLRVFKLNAKALSTNNPDQKRLVENTLKGMDARLNGAFVLGIFALFLGSISLALHYHLHPEIMCLK